MFVKLVIADIFSYSTYFTTHIVDCPPIIIIIYCAHIYISAYAYIKLLKNSQYRMYYEVQTMHINGSPECAVRIILNNQKLHCRFILLILSSIGRVQDKMSKFFYFSLTLTNWPNKYEISICITKQLYIFLSKCWLCYM